MFDLTTVYIFFLAAQQLREAFRMLQSEYKAVTEEAKAEVIGVPPAAFCTPRLRNFTSIVLQGL